MFRKRSEHHAGRIKFGFCDRFRETSFRTGTHVGAFSNHRGETTSRDSWGKSSGLRIEPGESKSRQGRFQEKIFARVFGFGASCQTDRDFAKTSESVRVTSREFPHPDFRLRAIFFGREMRRRPPVTD